MSDVVLNIDEQEFICSTSETVLEAALRHNVPMSHSCQAGACQSCMLRATEGEPSAQSQKGLKATLVAQGYFLACQHTLTENIAVTLEGAAIAYSSVSVVSNEALSESIHRIRFEIPDGFKYQSGQFINLRNEAGEVRSYSLAGVAELDELLEIHIRRLPGGSMSNWLCENLQSGSTVEIAGPFGDCFYLNEEEHKDKPILLIGTGSGLGPLFGIIYSALINNHRGEIFLYHGASTKDDLYLVDDLIALEENQLNFHYQPCLSSEADQLGYREGRAHDVALADNKELKEYLVYLCGNPEMVSTATRKAYIQGASMQNILSDAFVASTPKTVSTSS